ncbi:serine/threonine-protein kinase [Streptomyces sp. NBC_01304]|uniref:serine/threonine-protein kinase n=1 Tax=Streptomyces sp. NBC_01304 TaxID=2903818 RepID=UPI002E11FC1D|nr:serine/threonine protein kinase [Streptomyces sp. NBC_01304]
MAVMRIKPLDVEDPRRLGPYELLGRLTTGGMGRIYLARATAGAATVDGALVAVKTLLAEGVVGESGRRRFAREVELAKRVQSPRTARVIDADPEAARPWMAIEYIPAPALSDLVRDQGELGPPAVCWIGAGVVQALSVLHGEGIVHRDVKPQNILLPLDGPRLIDFGISHAYDITRTSLTLGTVAFTSPEQARAEQSTEASDVYSLGATLFYLAVGRVPYADADEPIRLLTLVQRGEVDLTGLPEELGPLIRGCLAAEPGERPELGAVLGQLRDGVSRTTTLRRGARRLPTAWRGLIEEYADYGRALQEGGPAATGDELTALLRGLGPTDVDTVERARRARARREEEARQAAQAQAREREERERREREGAERREQAEQERLLRRRRERERREREERERREREVPPVVISPPTPTRTSGSKASSGVVGSVLVVLAIVLLVWKPWDAKEAGGSSAGSQSGSSSGTYSSGGTGSTTSGLSSGSGGSGGSSSSGSTTGTSGDNAGSGETTDDETTEEEAEPSESPTPAADATELAFKRVSPGDCLTVYDTGDGGSGVIEWSTEVPPGAVSCGSDQALVKVTGTNAGSCAGGTGKGSWSYTSVSTGGDTRKLCLSRIYHANYCMLGEQSGDSISLGSLTATNCDRNHKVPVPYNQIMHITGVYNTSKGTDASLCRRVQGDQTRYWAWVVDDGATLLCTTILQGS